MSRSGAAPAAVHGLLLGAGAVFAAALLWPRLLGRWDELLLAGALAVGWMGAAAGLGRRGRSARGRALWAGLAAAPLGASLGGFASPGAALGPVLAGALLAATAAGLLAGVLPRPGRGALLAALLAGLLAGGCAVLRARQAAPARVTPPQLLLFGLDAAGWDLLEDRFAHGELPHLRGLVEDGAAGVLTAEAPLLSPALWTTIATGKHRAAHGILDFFATQADLRVPRLWDILAVRGDRAGLFQWLNTWPPTPGSGPGDGFVVPGWLARDPATRPPELAFVKELELSFQNEGVAAVPLARWRSWLAGYLRQGLRLRTGLRVARLLVAEWAAGPADDLRRYGLARRIQLALQGDVYLHLDRRLRPEFAASVWYGSDNLAHRAWRYYRPEDFGIPPEEAAPYADLLLDYYRDADRLLGEILAQAGPAVQVVVLSDHGYTSRDPADGAEPELDRHWVPRMEPLARWLELEPGAGVGIAKAARAGILTVRPDLAGGEELLARAEERLAALQAGDTPVFRLRRGAHHLELGVDPTLRLQPGEPLTGPAGPLAWEELLEYGERAGTHSPEGIWIARGPGFRRGVRLPAARQVDVLPTLLHLQGLPVGEDLPGRVVEEAIDPDFLARHPLRPLPSWDDRARPPRPATAGGDGDLSGRLRALGYLN